MAKAESETEVATRDSRRGTGNSEAASDFSPKARLSSLGLSAKKSFGQNFLTDPSISARIAELCTVGNPGVVLEIGAGLGALTAPLLERAPRVIAVERDRDLLPELRTRFAPAIESGQLQLMEADAQQLDLVTIFSPAFASAPHVLTGNLPYQLTGQLIERAVHASGVIDRAVFMVQLEVAQRLVAAPGSKTYGALSVFVQAAFIPRREMIVRAGAFYPAPRVDSAVVSFLRPPQKRAEETPMFRNLVRAAFQTRRKTLRNSWRAIAPLADLEGAAAEAGVNLQQRGETLSVEQFRDCGLALTARLGQESTGP